MVARNHNRSDSRPAALFHGVADPVFKSVNHTAQTDKYQAALVDFTAVRRVGKPKNTQRVVRKLVVYLRYVPSLCFSQRLHPAFRQYKSALF